MLGICLSIAIMSIVWLLKWKLFILFILLVVNKWHLHFSQSIVVIFCCYWINIITVWTLNTVRISRSILDGSIQFHLVLQFGRFLLLISIHNFALSEECKLWEPWATFPISNDQICCCLMSLLSINSDRAQCSWQFSPFPRDLRLKLCLASVLFLVTCYAFSTWSTFSQATIY